MSLDFSHIGLCCTDVEAMEKFYVGTLGMVVTDSGDVQGMRTVFLSSDPREHHEVVLVSGRPAGLPRNEDNPRFGAVINQISFRVKDVAALRSVYDRAVADKLDPIRPVNHGVSLSVYFPDPDGNLIEAFSDTGWFCTQPIGEPLDFSLSDVEIEESARRLCAADPSFSSLEDFQIGLAAKLAARP